MSRSKSSPSGGSGDAFQALLGRLEAAAPGAAHSVAGLPMAARAYLAARLATARPGGLLVVTGEEKGADRLAAELGFFLEGMGHADAVARLPAEEILPYDGLSPDRNTIQGRLGALTALRRAEGPRVLVVGPKGLARRLVPPGAVDDHAEEVAVGGTVDRDALARRLTLAGYQHVPMVEDPGTFTVRGGIFDVFSPLYEEPARLELFGDEVESIRLFDPTTQRTVAQIDRLRLAPARETLFTPANVQRATLAIRELGAEAGRPTRQLRTLLDEIEQGRATLGVEALLPAFFDGGLVPLADYLPGFDLVLVDDPLGVEAGLETTWRRLEEEYEAVRTQGELAFPPEAHFLSPQAALGQLSRMVRLDHHQVVLDEAAGRPLKFDVRPTAELRQEILAHHGEQGGLDPLLARLGRWRDHGWPTVLVASSPGQADRLRRLLEEREVPVRMLSGPPDLSLPAALYDPAVRAWLTVGSLESGFVDGHAGLALLSEADVLGHKPARRRRERVLDEAAFSAAFRELGEGDLVVHVEHGIGRYRGLTRLEVRGIIGDFLLLEYAGKDRVYLPVYRLGQLQKYVGGDPETVRLDKLGGSTFAVRKRKVKEELLKMAAELLDIYAARKAHPGTAFSAPDALFHQFEAEFPYQETRDQDRTIQEVLTDMQDPAPMDRLVIGDVGFGKTEVAVRAAVKAVLDQKQVAVLVPTTVLAAQHHRTFVDRLQGWPVVVEEVSRFRSAQATRRVLEATAQGKVDVLIGTHRLLSRDVNFKDLGLVIVDEEQRFGVSQKETLKKLRRQVDVLTLTATPIPRTLHMSLAGIRDLSVIATPPRDRRAVRTLVSRFDGEVIKEAVERELARGGQVFMVHNRVQSIGAVERYLKNLMPDLRLVMAHGQMPERKLEQAMTRFVEREADVLLATAIIESGLDMPSVNTILINRADTFGLAQLHQLRGRVGRSAERAYAYLLVPARRPISKEARQRLAVLQEHTELGAGFRLASRDLEIRGAGSLLGKEQSGQVAAVGFDLYSQMLEDAVRELKGEPPRDAWEPEVNLPVEAFIPESLIPDVPLRLDLYKRLSAARDDGELDDLRVEMVDRFGPLPEEVGCLFRVMAVKQALARHRFRAVDHGPERLVITLGPDARIDPGALARAVAAAERTTPGRLRLTPELKLVARVGRGLEGAAWTDAALALVDELAACAP